MEEYAGRVLAGRYRLPRPPADGFELVETRAFDAYSGQEVLVRQLLLPEVVPAEFDDDPFADDEPEPGAVHSDAAAERALRAARAAAAVPDHPRLAQVFDVLVEDGSLWVVSELVPGARPVAALLAFAPLTPYRAAEIAADLLTGLRALHAHGWTHRNITAATVLVCDDGHAMLDGLAFGAAQEALCGYDPVPAQAPETPASAQEAAPPDGAWGSGPESGLARERARQARLTVVGPVTERWSPEQAVGPVRGNWQLAPPVGQGTDLWALGALLFRCVQGHAAFPEENAAELVRIVCSEAAAPAEDCGPLRPVVESLLRPDPAERPGFEELGGWLRSLVRSAPEPDLGGAVSLPSDDPARLPIVRRKGEVVRQRRKHEKAARAAAKAAARGAGAGASDAAPAPADLPTAAAAGPRPRSTPGRPAAYTQAAPAAGPLPYPARQQAPAARPSTPPTRRPAPPDGPSAYADPFGTPALERQPAPDDASFAESGVPRGRHARVRTDAGSGFPPPGTPAPRVSASAALGTAPASAGTPGSPSSSRDAPEPRGTGTAFSGGYGSGHGDDAWDPADGRPGKEAREGGRRPRRLGLVLLGVVLVVLVALVGYAMVFGGKPPAGPDRSLPAQVSTGGSPATPSASAAPAATAPAATTTSSAVPQLAAGFGMRHDATGFTLAVHDGWSRAAGPDGEVVYASGGDAFRLTVVRGRDTAASSGGDPITYETEKEPELSAFRASTWSSSSGLKDLQVNGLPAAEGEFSWRDPHTGVQLYGLNLAILRDGHYDVVLLTGPDDQRALVTDYFNQSATTFRAD